mgnify:CR=1 FL=1
MIIDKYSPSLEEQVYERLSDDILSAKYSPGAALTELSLTRELGVSRTPVRTALHRLAEEGLVSITPNKGAVVIGVTREDLISTYEIRTRLEGLASRLAAENITDGELTELREALELQEFYISRRDTEHLRELDTKFHYLIYKASGNRPLLKILGELHKNIKMYRKRSLSVPGRLEQSVAEHREIFEAIAKRNANLADELTSRHIRCALENILSGG